MTRDVAPLGYRVLKAEHEVEAYVAKVARFADQHRESFGFLPDASYAEAAARGRLWVAVDTSNNLSAYLFFGGRYPNISVTQLFVSPSARRSGLAHLLVEELKQHAIAKSIQTISARVAADLPANVFWEKCGFLLLRQVKGGQATNRTINVRVFDVPDSSLWRASSDSSTDAYFPALSSRSPALVPNYVLDLNVFFDVIKSRIDVKSARNLISAAMASQLRLCVTTEFAAELSRSSMGGTLNDPVLALAVSLPTLPSVPSRVLETRISELRKIIFPETNRSRKRKKNDDSDLVHLATCIHHRTSAFVTREKAILRAADALERRYGLEVVSPTDLLQEPETSQHSVCVTADVGGAHLVVEVMRESERSQLERFLRNTIYADPEQQKVILDPGTTRQRQIRLVASTDAVIMGFCSYRCSGISAREITALIVVNENSTAAQQFVDHALQTLANEQPLEQPCTVRVQTVDSQSMVVSTALARGYMPVSKSDSNSSLVSVARMGYRGIVDAARWSRFRRQLGELGLAISEPFPTFLEATHTGILTSGPSSGYRPRRLANFEMFMAPVLLALNGRPAAVVPIREDFAVELLRLPRSQLPLLPGKEAPLHIERVYFGRTGLQHVFVRDGLVVFYVSGNANGRKAAVGMARVTSAGTVSIEQASREFSRHGVLECQTLGSIANKDGLVGMFAFDSFIGFRREVPYAQLRQMRCISGANLVTAQRLTSQQLMDIVAYAGSSM